MVCRLQASVISKRFMNYLYSFMAVLIFKLWSTHNFSVLSKAMILCQYFSNEYFLEKEQNSQEYAELL